MNEKRRNNDNGIRKYLSPTGLGLILLIVGFAITFAASIKAIPAIAKRSIKNTIDIAILQANYQNIKEGINDIKDLIKERR